MRIVFRILSVVFAVALAAAIAVGTSAAVEQQAARDTWVRLSARVGDVDYNRVASDQSYEEASAAAREVQAWAFLGGLSLMCFLLLMPPVPRDPTEKASATNANPAADSSTELKARFGAPAIDSVLGAVLTAPALWSMLNHSRVESPLFAAALGLLPLLPLLPHAGVGSGHTIGMLLFRRAKLEPLGFVEQLGAIALGPFRILFLWLWFVRAKVPRLFARLCLL